MNVSVVANCTLIHSQGTCTWRGRYNLTQSAKEVTANDEFIQTCTLQKWENLEVCNKNHETYYNCYGWEKFAEFHTFLIW